MKVKAALKTFGSMLYHNRATIETIVGGGLVVFGTAKVISKARIACEIADELEYKQMQIRRKDANEDWTDKKERSTEVKENVKYAVKEYVKCYGPGLALEALGLGLIAVSDITMNKELTATSALLATTSAAFSQYRERVIADVGEEKDQEYLLGPQFTTIDVMPDGTVIQTTEPIDNPNRRANLPPHCVFFDEACPNWEKDPKMNKDFLENHQRWLSEKLWAEGFLFENDIRRDLGLPLVKSGWTSGILATDKDGNRQYVNLGLDAKNPRAQAFRDGIEPTILLQLNVEDNIIEQLKWALI